MSNIYLNEFDRFIKYNLKPLAYMRYGDDWLCFVPDLAEADQTRRRAQAFLNEQLSLTVNPKIDYIQAAHQGTAYLGVDIWPNGRRLLRPVRQRIDMRLNESNVSSYRALVAAHEQQKWLKNMDWRLLDLPYLDYL